MDHFSIIIPTLNEEQNVLPLLQRLESMSSANHFKPEIIFVDDDSEDSTCEKIRSYTGSLDLRLIERKNERGLARLRHTPVDPAGETLTGIATPPTSQMRESQTRLATS